MSFYSGVFDGLGLREWCDADKQEGPMTMAQLLARKKAAAGGGGEEVDAAAEAAGGFPFPSLDNLHSACDAIPRTRDFTTGAEQAFLDVKDPMKVVLDPMTQPLSFLLDWALALFEWLPWFVLIPALLLLTWYATRAAGVVALVAATFLGMAFIDHYDAAAQTLAIVFVCTIFCVALGVPIGIGMARNDTAQRILIPVLDMLQTLPTFVYLIPLIFLFSVTESKLYGIAIILYAIVPVIRLTNLGIRLVDKDVIEAADAFGMTDKQKLFGVQIPLALPNIMAGVNQTIMMSLAMVVIASLVSAPGLGVLVLRGIRNLELGVGLVSGLCIVLLAIVLDRSTKAALSRIDKSER
ncbi:ABC transporter permease [Rhodovulum sp. DZ06]|uniref:ABC transporter permease n=1 Tax=Rhodovulum sp. DZ06 TaxID=3425126 RepID=UPI003D3528A0